MKRLQNNKGVALITAYVVISALITLSAGFAMSTANELMQARRHRDSAQAFWLAEAGLNQFIKDTTMLDEGQASVACGNMTCEKTITVNNQSVTLTKLDDTGERLVIATAEVNGINRSLQLAFEAIPGDIFEYTMSTGGNVDLDGNGGVMKVHGKTRITGVYTDSGKNLFAEFEDKVEGVDINLTTLTYPDLNNSLDADLAALGTGTSAPDEFVDFVQFYRDTLASYSEDEVAYFKGNGTLTITPNSNFEDIKIIFVEGEEGQGGINVVFDAVWESDQDLTLVSTGSINYIQPLGAFADDSRLNIVAWSDYYEPAALISAHDGITYTHGFAYLRDVWDISTTHGTIVANDYIDVKETMAWKEFFYDESIITNLPPGFAGMIIGNGSGSASYQTTPSSWKEI